MYLLIVVTFLYVSTLFLSVEAVEQPPLVYVKRDIKLSSYGYLLLNDTITLINNSTSPLRLPTLTLTYPTTAIDLQAQQPLSEDYVKIERFGNVTLLKLSADITIPALSNFTFTFRAVLGGLLKPVGGSRYELMAPLPSSPDNQLAEAVVTISLPADVSLASVPEGFKSESGSRWSTTLKGIQP
jgi:hypothetical protein